MTGDTNTRKGWCPGARRPMQAKDGLLVRLKISCGSLSAKTLRAIAEAGRNYGNGQFDLTARANLQLRGVREENLPRLIKVLDRFGLIDGNAAAEAVRNLLVSPLAGLDGRRDALSAARALEATLDANIDLYALPAKFGFLIDDGSALSLAGVPADIRFDWKGDEKLFLVAIGGTSKDAIALGHCEAKNTPQIATSIAHAFLRLTAQMPDPPRRMRALVENCGADAIAATSGLHVHTQQRLGKIEELSPIGLFRHHEKYHFGAGAFFGHLDAQMLDSAANGAELFAAGEIRLSPWRTLLFPNVQKEQAQPINDYFAAQGFVVDPEDPRLAVAACGGSVTCERGTTDTRSDALALMFAARRLCKLGVALQILGCGKGCGHQARTPLTLVANAGLYDLAADEAFSGQGRTNANQLPLAAVREKLEALTRDEGRQRKLHWP
jgi:precorrin-3B synthase